MVVCLSRRCFCDVFYVRLCMLCVFYYVVFFAFFFFFKQKTAYEMRISDWSSDVCSSDLSDATQCPVSRHQSMQSSKPLIRLLALWLGRRSFPTQSDRGRSSSPRRPVAG